MPKLILIDAHSYLHRAFHALPPLTTSKGEPVNAIYGFARTLFKLIAEQKPDYVAVCFDAPGPTFRTQMYSEYKATRKETDPDLRAQFPLSRELAQSMGLACFEKLGYEADDLIATLAKRGEKQGFDVVVISGDKDILQLVNERIQVWNENKQVHYDAAAVREKWGVGPEQIADVLTLMGDSSDNIPGVPGVGEKTAVKLIQDFGSLDGLLKSLEKVQGKLKEKLDSSREHIARSRKLVQLETEAPVDVDWDACRLRPQAPETLVPFLKRMEFFRLLNDLFAKGVLATPQAETQKFAERYETVLGERQLKELADRLKASKRFAFDVETTGLNLETARLVGISFAWAPGEAAYLPVGHDYLGVPEQLPLEKALKALRPALEDEKIPKVGQNLKFDYSVLAMHGVRAQNLHFDTMIASYCLDPARASHRLKDLASEFLGRTMTRIEELLPSNLPRLGSRELPMDKVEVPKVSAYSCADSDCSLQLADRFEVLLKEKGADKLFYETEMPLVRILAEMEMAGLRVDRPYLEKLDREFSAEILKIEKEAHRLAGQEFNLGSPKQLSFILFEKLGLTPVKKTKTGFSTDEEVLSSLSASHELPRVLLRHRELSKLKSTYIDGLLSLARRDTDRVHSSFNQAITTTGRLSSSEPNLQNIPIRSEYGLMIRRAFVPEPGKLFLSADYSQIDLRVLAHFSKDEALCRAFREGDDIHRATAAEVFGVPPDQVTEEQRRRAKAVNFGIVYGQQAFGLSQSLGIPMAEAQDLIDRYFKRYSGVKEWIEETKRRARADGFVKTLLGRTRYLPEIGSKNASVRSFAERLAVNTPVQGTSADIIKVAMIRIDRAGLDARMLLQVHDDLLFEVPPERLGELSARVKDEMENAVELAVPLEVSVKQGKNWADMESAGKKAPVGH